MFFVDTGAGIVASHSNCSIYEEATNAYKLGYAYVVLLADYQSDYNDYSLQQEDAHHFDRLEERLLQPLPGELRKLEVFVAIVSKGDYERAIFLSSRYQNSISQPLRSTG